MLNKLSSIIYMLAQNATEKRMTKLGVALFVGFLVILLIHTTIKDGWLPKSKSVTYFVIFLFIISVVALILLLIFL